MKKFKTVNEFMSALNENQRTQVQVIRQFILDESPTLVEHIKWNAPSYVKDGEDRITFNTLNKDHTVKLVFHMGASRKEDKNGKPILENASLIEWVSDIRGYMTFNGLDEIRSAETDIKRIVRDWLLLS